MLDSILLAYFNLPYAARNFLIAVVLAFPLYPIIGYVIRPIRKVGKEPSLAEAARSKSLQALTRKLLAFIIGLHLAESVDEYSQRNSAVYFDNFVEPQIEAKATSLKAVVQYHPEVKETFRKIYVAYAGSPQFVPTLAEQIRSLQRHYLLQALATAPDDALIELLRFGQRMMGQLENSAELCRLTLAGQFPEDAQRLIGISDFDELAARVIAAAAQSPVFEKTSKLKLEEAKKDIERIGEKEGVSLAMLNDAFQGHSTGTTEQCGAIAKFLDLTLQLPPTEAAGIMRVLIAQANLH